jgi:gas vesicle protein
MSKDTGRKFALGALIAAAAGYVAGVLTAPKAGKESRADIKEATGKGIDEVEKQVHALHDELNQLIADAKKQGAKLSAKAKSELDAAANKAGQAKEKSTEVLKAVRAGSATDKDLQKTLDEAKAAIKHLRKYLAK